MIADPADPKGVADRFAADPGPAPVERSIATPSTGCSVIDTVEEIFAALEADGSDWAQKQLSILKTKSPQSHEGLAAPDSHRARGWASFAENMAMEYRLGGRVVRTHDFQEGVRAVIVDKDNAPKWSPADLAGVTDAQLDALFAPLPADEEWTPL